MTDSSPTAPIWQRIFCGLLCAGALLALPMDAIHGTWHGWHEVLSLLIAVYGAYLFGYIAWRGRMPGKDPGTGYVHLRRRHGHRGR